MTKIIVSHCFYSFIIISIECYKDFLLHPQIASFLPIMLICLISIQFYILFSPNSPLAFPVVLNYFLLGYFVFNFSFDFVASKS